MNTNTKPAFKKPALFKGKATTLAALDNLIDRNLLPQGPIANKVWDKEDEGSSLVFVNKHSTSPIGRMFEASRECVIVIDGVRFSSIASVWAYVSYQTKDGQADDQLRTRSGDSLFNYLTALRRNNILIENKDYNHQWTAITTALVKYVVSNTEEATAAVESHKRHYKMAKEDIERIEFIDPQGRSKFKTMYEEVINLSWPIVVQYLEEAKITSVKKTTPLSTRMQSVLEKAYEEDMIVLSQKQCVAANVDDSWFTLEAFIESINSGQLKFHTESSVLTKLWAEKGVEGFDSNHADFLLACGMARRHHPWVHFDFMTTAPQELPSEKITLNEIVELISNPVYKDFVIGLHSLPAFEENAQSVTHPYLQVSEEFNVRMWQALRAVIFFNRTNPKTRFYFEEDALKLMDAVQNNDIMYAAAGPTGFMLPVMFGQSFKAVDEEIIKAQEIVSFIAKAVYKSADVSLEVISREVFEVIIQETDEQPTDFNKPAETISTILDIYMPSEILESLTAKPKYHNNSNGYNNGHKPNGNHNKGNPNGGHYANKR
jgi:hypothetical protein